MLDTIATWSRSSRRKSVKGETDSETSLCLIYHWFHDARSIVRQLRRGNAILHKILFFTELVRSRCLERRCAGSSLSRSQWLFCGCSLTSEKKKQKKKQVEDIGIELSVWPSIHDWNADEKIETSRLIRGSLFMHVRRMLFEKLK